MFGHKSEGSPKGVINKGLSTAEDVGKNEIKEVDIEIGKEAEKFREGCEALRAELMEKYGGIEGAVAHIKYDGDDELMEDFGKKEKAKKIAKYSSITAGACAAVIVGVEAYHNIQIKLFPPEFDAHLDGIAGALRLLSHDLAIAFSTELRFASDYDLNNKASMLLFLGTILGSGSIIASIYKKIEYNRLMRKDKIKKAVIAGLIEEKKIENGKFWAKYGDVTTAPEDPEV